MHPSSWVWVVPDASERRTLARRLVQRGVRVRELLDGMSLFEHLSTAVDSAWREDILLSAWSKELEEELAPLGIRWVKLGSPVA